MRGLLIFLIAILSLLLIVYMVPSYREVALRALSYSECDASLAYKIASIDARFGLSNSKALNDINTATSVWSGAEGKALFRSSPDANLTVHFIYDQRQALDTQINELNSSLSQKNASLRLQVDEYQSQVA